MANRFQLPLFCFALLSLALFFLVVTQGVSAAELIREPDVVVIGQQISADEVDIGLQTGRVTVIDRQQFATDLATVADVLRQETGVQIRQLSGLGSYSTVNIRGATNAQVNVYLDGVLLNSAQGGSVDLSQFTLGSVERIEIYRGNVPVQLGVPGIGGAINIRTMGAEEQSNRQVSLSYGSFSTAKLAGVATENIAGAGVIVAAEYLTSDNDYPFTNNNLTPSNPHDDREEHRNNADFDQIGGLLKTDYRLSDTSLIQFVAQLFSKEQGIPEVSNNPATRSQLETDFQTAQMKLSHLFSGDTSVAFTLFGTAKEELYDDTQNRIGLSANKEKGETKTIGTGLVVSSGLDGHYLGLSLDMQKDEYENQDLLRDLSNRYDRSLLTLGVQDEWMDRAADHLISLSLRGYYLDDNGESGNSDTEDYYSVHSGWLFDVSESLQLRVNLSRDIRIPTLTEKFGDRGFSIGNPDLEAETAVNFDLGIGFDLEAVQGSVTYFYRDLKDGIFTVFDARGIGRSENISEAGLQGLEIDVSSRYQEIWLINVRATYQDTEDRSDSADFRGNSLPGHYDLSGLLANGVYWGDLELKVEYELQRGGYYDRSSIASMPDVDQWNVVTKWRGDQYSIEFGLKNITDQRIQDFNRFPGPGRRFYVSYLQEF